MWARRIVAAVVVVVSLVGFGGSANAAPAMAVNGSGMVVLPPEYGEFAGDPVWFQLHTSGASGRFDVVHLDEAGLYAHVTGDVTCVSVSEGVAVTTGIVRHAYFRDFPGSEAVDMAVAITVADGGTNDAISFDFEFFGSTISPCQAITPVIPVTRGNFVIR